MTPDVVARWVREEERRGYWFGALGNVCAALGILLAFPGVDTRPGLRVLALVLLAGAVVCAALSLLALLVLRARRRRR